MDCPFCCIAHEKERVILETPHTIVILSNPYLVEGHLLVIPKRHIEKPWEMTTEERRELFDTVLLMQKRIIEKFSTGCDIREHYRPFLPQSRVKVNHIHSHLHPRELEDPLYTKSQIGERELWKDLSEGTTEKIKKILGT
jgi:histidine triad (HIT) family protein